MLCEKRGKKTNHVLTFVKLTLCVCVRELKPDFLTNEEERSGIKVKLFRSGPHPAYGEFVSAGTREVVGFCVLVIFEVFYLYFVVKHRHSVQNEKKRRN